MTCPNCDGTGTVEVVACTNSGPWQECCGGCGFLAACNLCGGSGQVEAGTCTCCGAVVPEDTLEPDGSCQSCIA